jgi:hypothetical protein
MRNISLRYVKLVLLQISVPIIVINPNIENIIVLMYFSRTPLKSYDIWIIQKFLSIQKYWKVEFRKTKHKDK